MTTNHPAINPQLDTIETTGPLERPYTYRDFLVSSCRTDIDFNRLIYSCIDDVQYKNNVGKFDDCRTYAYFVRHKATHQVRVQSTACRLRWCPLCMKSKRYIISNEVAKWVTKVKKPKFLTFTLKHNEDSLHERIKDLYRFFRNVRRTEWFKHNVRGGVWFFQVTRSKNTGQWHPHIHCLVDSNFLPKEKLSDLWELITGDSRIVDIRAIKDIKKTVDYVARYATAPCRLSNFTVDDAIEIVDTLHGRRLCGTWGTGSTMSFKIKKPDDWHEWERVGNWRVIWHDKANPHWCRMIRLAWIHGQPLNYEPPPDLQGAIPWDNEKSIAPETFRVTQSLLF